MPPEVKPKPKSKPAADPAGAPLITDPGVINPFPNGDRAPKPAADPVMAPGATAGRKRRKSKVTDQQIREALSDLLTAPGVPFSMLRMDWAANHVFRTGPEFADALVAYSKTNEWLREQLERLARGDNAIGAIIAVFAVVTAGSNYLIPLLVYFGVAPRSLGEMFTATQIPERPVYGATRDQAPDAPTGAPASPIAHSFPG